MRLKEIKFYIKNKFIELRLKQKYKNSNISISKRAFISLKARIILGDSSELFIGDNSYISDNTRLIVHNNSKLIIGNRVYISWNSLVSSNSSVSIGDDTSIAHFVTIIDTNKNYGDITKKIKEQSFVSREISISEDCWIGTGAVILGGAQIGQHCVIAANSVVNKSFSKNTVIGGVPAKILKNLDE